QSSFRARSLYSFPTRRSSDLRATADHMGMLGTVINGLALKEMLATLGQPARCVTAIDIPAVAEPFIRGRAIRHLEKGSVVVLARSEEHTSELQSRENLVCRLL